MQLTAHLLLFFIRTDILLWVAGLTIIIVGIFFIWWQLRQKRLLKKELQLLEDLNKRNVEFELVLKAMKLATWKFHIPTQTVTFDSDFREYNNYSPLPDTDVSQVWNHIFSADAEKGKQALMDLLDGKTDEVHVEYQMKAIYNDKPYWGESYAMVGRRGPDGRPIEIIGTSRRIDEQKRIEQELKDALFHAEESDRLKTAFLANISHEIRTPLNAIVGFSDVLPMVEDREERQKLIALIQENNQKLLRMINDIVNIAKLEAGASQARQEDFSLNILLQDVKNQYGHQAQVASVDFLVAKRPDVTLNSDRDRLFEVLKQYVLNALKFTHKGSITIGYDMMPDKGVRLWVSDTGCGIPASQQDKIFDHFVKLDDFVPGTGLGLPICRSLARTLGARVGVDSKEGEGSTFWIEVPQKV